MGLSEKEAKIYLALLELRQSSAYKIALRAGVKKPTNYVLLDDLMKKELVLKMPGEKTQMFIAKSPEEFFDIAQNKVNSAVNVLPEIMSVMKKENKVRTIYFEGTAGIKQAIFYDLDKYKNQELVGFYA